MSKIEAAIKRHSLLIYFALVFVISWGGGFLIRKVFATRAEILSFH